MRGMYWEEWDIGAEFTSPARTVTEADIVMFAGLSGDFNPLHINEEYCKTTQFGTREAKEQVVTLRLKGRSEMVQVGEFEVK